MLKKLCRELLLRIKVNRNNPVVSITVLSAVGGLNLPSLEVEEALKAVDLFVLLYLSSSYCSRS